MSIRRKSFFLAAAIAFSIAIFFVVGNSKFMRKTSPSISLNDIDSFNKMVCREISNYSPNFLLTNSNGYSFSSFFFSISENPEKETELKIRLSRACLPDIEENKTSKGIAINSEKVGNELFIHVTITFQSRLAMNSKASGDERTLSTIRQTFLDEIRDLSPWVILSDYDTDLFSLSIIINSEEDVDKMDEKLKNIHLQKDEENQLATHIAKQHLPQKHKFATSIVYTYYKKS